MQAQAWPRADHRHRALPGRGGDGRSPGRWRRNLEQQLGQGILIDDRGGAGGTVGAPAALRAATDGYTFFVGAAHHAIAPALVSRLDYNIQTDFIPIGSSPQPPQVVVVHPGKVEAKTLAELIEYGQEEPGEAQLRLGRQRHDTTSLGELFKLMSKAKLHPCALSRRRPLMQDWSPARSISPSTVSAPRRAQIAGASSRRWPSPRYSVRPPSPTYRLRRGRPARLRGLDLVCDVGAQNTPPRS